MHTGKLIREMRVSRGISQAKLAGLLLWDQQRISRLERSATAVTTTLVRVAEALGFNLQIEFIERSVLPGGTKRRTISRFGLTQPSIKG